MDKKDKFVIEGLSGEKTLEGEIDVKGSKNAALPLMASAVLFDNPIILENVPEIEDVVCMSELLKSLGISTDFEKDEMKIDATAINDSNMDRDVSRKIRASIFLVGPILARLGKVSFPHPGGCVIGNRPIDLFLEGFEKMGAEIKEEEERYFIEAPNKKLKGAEIFFRVQSVSATATFMMTAVLAEGKTILKNIAMEPEVLALGEFLKSRGAKISGLGTSTLEIEGGELLSGNGEKIRVIPDRLEAGCFLVLGALAAKNLKIKNCNPDHLEILVELLKKSGVEIEVGHDFLSVTNSNPSKVFSGFDIKTHEYPGFPTDLQAPITVFLTQTEGESHVFETIFESRLNYTEDLVKMGADIVMWDPHRVMVKGPTPLRGKDLEGPDIRAGLAFLIAAVIASKSSIINNVYYIDRGYEKIEERLQKIGVNIERVSE